jgi:putative transposase
MPHSYATNYLHIVFSTKDRRDLISKETQPKLWAYFAGVAKNIHSFTRIAGGTSNHVHILLHLPSDLPLAKAVLLLKSNSSKWMNTHTPLFAWQEGYAAFSVSASNLNRVSQYIQNQEAHHRKITFENEFLALLRKHRVSFDPKFVFG